MNHPAHQFGVIACSGILLLIPVIASAETPLPQYPKGAGEKCVAPVDEMRRNHMEMLRYQRDETVHLGIRPDKESLKGCIQCHVQKDKNGRYLPVNGPGQFCGACHSYVAVSIDCFQCHATKPEDG